MDILGRCCSVSLDQHGFKDVLLSIKKKNHDVDVSISLTAFDCRFHGSRWCLNPFRYKWNGIDFKHWIGAFYFIPIFSYHLVDSSDMYSKCTHTDK